LQIRKHQLSDYKSERAGYFALNDLLNIVNNTVYHRVSYFDTQGLKNYLAEIFPQSKLNYNKKKKKYSLNVSLMGIESLQFAEKMIDVIEGKEQKQSSEKSNENMPLKPKNKDFEELKERKKVINNIFSFLDSSEDLKQQGNQKELGNLAPVVFKIE